MSFVKIVPMAESVSCASGETRELGFDVINSTESEVRIGVEPIGDAKEWVKVDRAQVELSLPARAQEKIKVAVAPPAAAAGSKSSFQLRVYRLEDPADAVESSAISVDVAAVPDAKPVEPAPPAPPKSVPWGLIIGVSAAVVVIALAGVLAFVLTRSDGVPNLVGMTRDEALAALADAEITPNVVEEFTGEAEAGRVIRQDPAAGTDVPEDATVDVVVEMESVDVPQLVGLNTRAASDALTAAGLAVGETTAERTGNSPGGAVIRQDPSAGSRAIPGTPVAITVEQVVVRVPDLKGLTLDRASAVLESDGLRVQPRDQIEAGAAPGTVVAQEPAAGTEVDASAVVAVDLQAARVQVPSVLNKSLDDAARALSKANLVLAPVQSDFQRSPPFGVVSAQVPKAGDSVAPGSKVTLRVRTQVPAPEPRPAILRRGTLAIKQTFTADLDAGKTGAGAAADIWFEAETATRRFLVGRSGGTLAFMGTRAPDWDGCRKAKLGNNKIAIDSLKVGTYVCVKTNQGRFAQLRVTGASGPSPGTLTVQYITWR